MTRVAQLRRDVGRAACFSTALCQLRGRPLGSGDVRLRRCGRVAGVRSCRRGRQQAALRSRLCAIKRVSSARHTRMSARSSSIVTSNGDENRCVDRVQAEREWGHLVPNSPSHDENRPRRKQRAPEVQRRASTGRRAADLNLVERSRRTDARQRAVAVRNDEPCHHQRGCSRRCARYRSAL